MEKVVGSGKTLEAAINDGLKKLGIERSQAEFELLQTGGFFKSYKVSVSKSEEEKISFSETIEIKTETITVQPKTEKAEPQPKVEKAVTQPKKEKLTSEAKKEKPLAEGKKEKPFVLPKAEKAVAQPQKESNKPTSDGQSKIFLQTLLSKAGFDLTVSEEETPEEIILTVEGSDTATIIGHRGECLDSLQFLTNVIANEGQSKKHIAIDCENYRQKRVIALTKLAHNLEKKVVRTGRRTKLEPMNSYERRILHTALKDSTDVVTHSEGAEPYRFVVIEPSDKTKLLKKEQNQNQNQPRVEQETTDEDKGGTYGNKHKKLNFVYRTKSKKPFTK